MGRGILSSFGGRLLRRMLADPRNYPAWNYQLPADTLARLWQRGLAAIYSRLVPTLDAWEDLFGTACPRLLVLNSPKVGGSHFALHHLQRHPGLLCLHEVVFARSLHKFWGRNRPSIYEMAAGQLIPYKADLSTVKYFVVNKPFMETVVAWYRRRRDEITVLNLVRNPAAYCLGRAAQDSEGEDLPGYYLTVYKQWIRQGVDFFHPERDLALNLEYFAAHPSQAIEIVTTKLGLPPMPPGNSLALEQCVRCGRRLSVEPRAVKSRRYEPVLVCPRCRAVYIGPGGFNLLRQLGPADFRRWTEYPDAQEVISKCEAFFGRDFMAYCNASLILDTELKQVTLSKTRRQSCPNVASSARNSRPGWFSKSSVVPSPQPNSVASTA